MEAAVIEEEEYKKTGHMLRVLWNVMYWSVFFLTWAVLPFFQEYENAGEFTKREKIK